jgi:phage shock protein A
MTGVSDDLNGLGAALEQTEQRTESMQAQASAIDELVQLGVLEMPGQTNGNALASALDGAGDANAVEERLAAMKIEVAS